MRVVAFNGSPRVHGNTQHMLEDVVTRLAAQGMSCEIMQIGGELIRGCTACLTCRQTKDGTCIHDDDIVNEAIAKMVEADVIIMGSPTYFAALTPELKALIDRAGYVTRSNGIMLRRKIGAAVVAVRRAGALNVFQAINNFFLINEMIVPGSTYWNLSTGGGLGAYEQDEEGMGTMARLADNITWLAERVR